MEKEKLSIPLTEKLKSITGFFGLHLNEMPKYKVLKEQDAFELREYEPILIAKTTVQGTHDKAKEEGFEKLAGYIFGKNKGEKKMAMTSPVLQEEGKKMSMTSPVIMEMKDANIANSESLTMSFVLPHDVTAANAPIPNDPSIQLQEIPAQTWAAIKYSGTNDPVEIEAKSQDLQNWIKSIGHKVDLETMRVAQYDSPMTIPALRRNEVQFRIWSAEIH